MSGLSLQQSQVLQRTRRHGSPVLRRDVGEALAACERGQVQLHALDIDSQRGELLLGHRAGSTQIRKRVPSRTTQQTHLLRPDQRLIGGVDEDGLFIATRLLRLGES